MERFLLKGRYKAECYDGDNLLWTDYAENLVTNEGYNAVLDIMFHADTQITTWYFAPVETDTTAAVTMTYATPVFTESTAYDEATRQAWTEAAASSQSMTSASVATITISATKTLYGLALVGGGTAATTKGDAAGGGTLWSYAKFGAGHAVVDGNVINLTYTTGKA